MKKNKLILFTFVVLILARIVFYSMTDGFSLKRIQFPKIAYTPSNPPNQTELSLLQDAFKQPYFYLAKGSQAYAFESEDKQYILKLFKCHHWNDGSWAENLPLPERLQNWLNSLVKRRRDKIANTRNSFRIVKDKLTSECGVFYIQDTPAQSYDLTVTIIDRAGRRHLINPYELGFALQKKATLVFPTLESWAKSQELDKIKNSIESMIALMYRRCQKGIYDSDPDIHKNAGLLGERAIFIDIGSFHEKEQIRQSSSTIYDIQKSLKSLIPWVQKNAPSLEPFLTKALHHPETCMWHQSEGETLESMIRREGS